MDLSCEQTSTAGNPYIDPIRRDYIKPDTEPSLHSATSSRSQTVNIKHIWYLQYNSTSGCLQCKFCCSQWEKAEWGGSASWRWILLHYVSSTAPALSTEPGFHPESSIPNFKTRHNSGQPADDAHSFCGIATSESILETQVCSLSTCCPLLCAFKSAVKKLDEFILMSVLKIALRLIIF